MAAQGRRVVKLQVGEPDFSTPRHVIDASIASLEECDTHYAPNRGIFSLREAVSEKLKKDNGIAYNPESEILILNGLRRGPFLCGQALVDPERRSLLLNLPS